MVKHIVFWKLKEEAHGFKKPELALEIKKRLQALNGKIEGLLHLEVGLDFSKTESSFEVVLYSEFTDKNALDAYQIHPLHKEVAGFIGGATSARHLVDYKV
ncbi:Dabb family protein [Xanthovirga aplysinae]|uniref:Dabb family protein n=1 Tax=Xanthovirga aplysinae TaxID=2529853 RepID=UPI0012BC51A8|nr:Dabb family protein [Xanthovirga aplysinae]MTI31507.1 Dabb family protein [Xanthovirga aplysinae]